MLTKNVLGGLAAAFALVAIFIFSHHTPTVTPPVAKPAPVAVHVAPKVEPPKVEQPKPAPKVEPPKAPAPKVTFYRVEQGGKQGAAVECSSVKSFADGKSPAELAALAKQYGVSESDLKRYYVCNN